MRFLMLLTPSNTTTRFNHSLARAGSLLAWGRLRPLSAGARITSREGKVTSTAQADGTRAISEFWIIDVGTRAEAIEWARRAPLFEGDTIEILQLQDPEAGDADAG